MVSGGESNITLRSSLRSENIMRELMQFMDPMFLLTLPFNLLVEELKLDIGVSEEKHKSLDFC